MGIPGVGRIVAAVAAVTLVGACSSGGSSGASAPATPSSAGVALPSSPGTGDPLPTPDHVVVVVFENKDAQRVEGGQAPYLRSLAARGAAFTDAHGETHPSQPNYLALFSGSTQGLHSDACPQSFDGGNLAAQLQAAGKTFVGYSEDLPRPGFTGCGAGGYARKHNPWVDFPALPAAVNQPLSALPDDFATWPTVAFLVPDLCHDMHDCSVATGDAWARKHLDPYVAWATAHNSLLIVTFDEDEGTAANHITTIVAGADVRPGSTSAERIDHYSLLRTIEDMYGLAPLGSAADAAPLSGIWTTAASETG